MPFFRRALGGVVLGIAAVLATNLPASAHDELVASSPEPDARLSAAPDEVVLTFSDEPLALDGAGVAVVVTDIDGADWLAGAPTVSERTVSAPIKDGMPSAGYEIRWRVVSADGHPISGVIPFTVGDAAPLRDTADDTSVAPRRPDVDTGRSAAEIEQQSAEESSRILRVTLFGTGGALIAGTAYILITIFRRRRRGASSASASS